MRLIEVSLRLCAVAAVAACAPGRGAARPGSAAPAALALVRHVEHLDSLGREPMVVEHPDGTLFVAGYGRAHSTLWKSADRGRSWSRVDVERGAGGLVGNSDVDLAVARDGTLYFASMHFDRAAGEGRQIAVGVSRDAGATWAWTRLSRARFDDRPWVKVAPDGTAHVIWNDGSGVSHAVSRDRGATWTRGERVHPRGGSSHLAVGPAGEVAVRVTPASASANRFDPGVDLVAVSTDAGATWRTHPAPGNLVWDTAAFNRWVEPLAWDERGALYSFWADGRALWLARSADRGATWTSWPVAEGRDSAFFPYLAARGAGELAATWSSGAGATLQWHLAHLAVRDDGRPPRVVESAPYRTDVWRIRGGGFTDPPIRDTAGEYLAVAFLRDGTLAVVTPIQAPGRRGFAWWSFELR